MTSKKKTAATANTNLQSIKLGSGVRCTDDGVQGRIVWANAVSVKIRWDDGEQVTWRRDSLANRPIEILAEGSEENQPESPSAPDGITPADQAEQIKAEPEAAPAAPALAIPAPDQTGTESPAEPMSLVSPPVEQSVDVPSSESTEEPVATVIEQMPAAATQVQDALPLVVAQEEHTSPEKTEQPDAPSPTTKLPQPRKSKDVRDGKEKRLGALNAAAKVLMEAGQPMTCQEMIAAMAAKGYWTSPGGKTPQATLYSAILREISTKGSHSRFVKIERGKFAHTGAA